MLKKTILFLLTLLCLCSCIPIDTKEKDNKRESLDANIQDTPIYKERNIRIEEHFRTSENSEPIFDISPEKVLKENILLKDSTRQESCSKIKLRSSHSWTKNNGTYYIKIQNKQVKISLQFALEDCHSCCEKTELTSLEIPFSTSTSGLYCKNRFCSIILEDIGTYKLRFSWISKGKEEKRTYSFIIER